MPDQENEIKADDVKSEETIDARETVKDLEPRNDPKGGIVVYR